MSGDNDAIAGQLIETMDPGAFVTKYMIVAEVIDSDGVRGIWSDTHDGATRWDTYGLLMEALTAEQAQQARDSRDEDDPE